MNIKVIFNTVGKVAIALGGLMIIPLALALALGESAWVSIAISVGIAFAFGILLVLCFKTQDKSFFSQDGMISVALSWIVLSVLGALPFCISGAIPSFVDALFESASGFTTTGASILTSEALNSMFEGSKSLILWRSFTHWVGGMGVLVFVLLFSSAQDRSMHILRAEMPGPTVDKITPRARDTAKTLYLIYIALTLLEVIALCLCGQNLFNSVVYSFGTAGTGGFGMFPDSLASESNAVQWVVTVFMLVFGVNFNLYFLVLCGRLKSALKSRELWTFLAIVLASTAMLTVSLTVNGFGSVGESIRLSAFQVSSFITTTGYSTADFDAWPVFAKALLFILMFIGGCAGSTAGGLKVSRVVLLIKKVRNEISRILHPRTATTVQFEGKVVDTPTLNGVTSYFALYMLIILGVFLLLCLDSFEGMSFETNMTASVSCVNNIGPAYGVASANYSMFSPFSKVVLTLAMLFGRLEIYPLITLLSPSTYKK